MKTRYSFMLAALALTFAFATPVLAQDVAKEGEALATEKMESHNEMMGEGCQCSCMKEMHEKMMKMHGDAEGMAHEEDEDHAEGMDSDEVPPCGWRARRPSPIFPTMLQPCTRTVLRTEAVQVQEIIR